MENKSFKEIINGNQPVLVDFFATWCGPCKQMSPILDQFKNEVGEGVKVIKIDVDKNPKAAQVYAVRGVPTLILFKNGEIKWRQSGVLSSAQLQNVLSLHG
ncbi:thioredoxin [Flavobacteriaceae bacterium]|nr:thioredoxin [Flavobacteriaceae bacterium]